MGLFRFLYCALLLHVGMGASFVLPLVREGAGRQASLVFGLYFGAIVLAELVTYRVAAIRHWRFGVPASAVVYMASFVIMATVAPPSGLVVGRVIEGLAIGVRVPLLFRDAMTSDAKSRNRMLVAMGSLYSVGYVTGPFVADLMLSVLSRGSALVVFGVVSLLISVAMEAVRPGGVGLEREEPADPPPVRRFMFLFVAKFFYGFLLVSITAGGGPRLFSDRISILCLGLAVVFTVGQSLAARLVGRVSLAVLGTWFASGLSLGCVAYGTWPGSGTLVLAAVAQGALYFIGQRIVGAKPADSKTFALFSALSDPGSALGALSGRLGTSGAFIVATVALVPIALEAIRRSRATS